MQELNQRDRGVPASQQLPSPTDLHSPTFTPREQHPIATPQTYRNAEAEAPAPIDRVSRASGPSRASPKDPGPSTGI